MPSTKSPAKGPPTSELSSLSLNSPAKETPNGHSSTSSPSEPWTVESVISTLNPPISATKPASSPIPFMHLLERLKTTPREGWRRFAISKGETIADHMYRMSIMTLLAPPQLSSRLNIPHCTRMALIHDMAESLVGDITPVDENVPKEEKARREAQTMDFIASKLLSATAGIHPAMGADIRAIFEEYEAGETLNSRFVHDIDKVELLLQMVEYERSREGRVDLGEFIRVARNIQLDECKAWCEEIFVEREEFWKSVGKPLEEGWRRKAYKGN